MKSISVICLQNRREKALYCVLALKRMTKVERIPRKANQLRRKRVGEIIPQRDETKSKPNNFMIYIVLQTKPFTES